MYKITGNGFKSSTILVRVTLVQYNLLVLLAFGDVN
jgi:hypothetical protein